MVKKTGKCLHEGYLNNKIFITQGMAPQFATEQIDITQTKVKKHKKPVIK